MPNAAPLFTTWMMLDEPEAVAPTPRPARRFERTSDLGELVEADDDDAAIEKKTRSRRQRAPMRAPMRWARPMLGAASVVESFTGVRIAWAVVGLARFGGSCPHAGGHTGPPLQRGCGRRGRGWRGAVDVTLVLQTRYFVPKESRHGAVSGERRHAGALQPGDDATPNTSRRSSATRSASRRTTPAPRSRRRTSPRSRR